MNAITKANKTELATATAFDDFAGAGFGHQDASDFLIPRYAVLGDLSPQIKKNKAEYIEGAEVGDIVDVAMGEILAKQGQTTNFLPVLRVKEAIEWKPRSAGGGIVNRVILNESMDDYAGRLGVTRNDKFEYINKSGNEIIETWQYYGLNLDRDNRWSFIPMKKSNLKVARKWNTRANAIKLPNGAQAPLFYKTYKLGTFLDSGNQNEWYNWEIKDGPLLQDYAPNWQEIFQSAVNLKKAVESGQAKGDVRGVDEENASDDAF